MTPSTTARNDSHSSRRPSFSSLVLIAHVIVVLAPADVPGEGLTGRAAPRIEMPLSPPGSLSWRQSLATAPQGHSGRTAPSTPRSDAGGSRSSQVACRRPSTTSKPARCRPRLSPPAPLNRSTASGAFGCQSIACDQAGCPRGCSWLRDSTPEPAQGPLSAFSRCGSSGSRLFTIRRFPSRGQPLRTRAAISSSSSRSRQMRSAEAVQAS